MPTSITVISDGDTIVAMNETDKIVIGKVLVLCDEIYKKTTYPPVAVILHPEYMRDYLEIYGLPVIRSHHAPIDRPLIAWGYP